MKSRIEWCDYVWNPVRGCTRVSPGCDNCYAARHAARLGCNPGTPQWHGYATFGEAGPKWTGIVELDPEKLTIPQRWKNPSIVFVNSMSDLFHPSLPEPHVHSVLDAIQRTPWHRFIVLTKRAGRMREIVSRWVRLNGGLAMPQLWLGVSAEDEKWLEQRVGQLLATPAAIRLLSAEPLLGRLQLAPYLVSRETKDRYAEMVGGFPAEAFPLPQHLRLRPSLDWVIAGGESGPGARPVEVDWIRDIRRICQKTGTPFFFKQWGEWLPAGQDGAGNILNCSDDPIRVGKAKAGCLLDGQEYKQFPEVPDHVRSAR